MTDYHCVSNSSLVFFFYVYEKSLFASENSKCVAQHRRDAGPRVRAASDGAAIDRLIRSAEKGSPETGIVLDVCMYCIVIGVYVQCECNVM